MNQAQKLQKKEAENALLRAQIREAEKRFKEEQEKRQQAEAQRQQAAFQIEVLEHELANLKRFLFGQKRERFVSATDPGQLVLDLGLEEVAAPEVEEKEVAAHTRTTAKSKAKPTGRQPWPAHLRRVETVLLPEGEDLQNMKQISEHRTEFLEYLPSEPFVRVIVRPIFADPEPDPQTGKTRVVIAELPERIVPKISAGVGLLAAIICDKFLDHLPLYRQMKRYIRLGVAIPKSTMVNWLRLVAEQLDPLYLALKKEVLRATYLQIDETRMQVLEESHNQRRSKKAQPPDKTHRGYFWTYYDPKHKLCYFEYAEGRGKEYPELCLDGFSGKIQTDGYAVYTQFDRKDGITLCGCLAHVRRKFFEAKGNDLARATQALNMIQGLYTIEQEAREQNMSDTQRQALRQQKARPIWEEFAAWLELEKDRVLPKSPIGTALTYAYNRQSYLARYLEDGAIEIDNNLVENQIRPVALGRKNYLFAGSAKGAQRAAMFYSLLGSCSQHGIDPFSWLLDIMLRLPTHPISQIDELLPHRWKPDPQAAPVYRIGPMNAGM